MIPFNKFPMLGTEFRLIEQALNSSKISGDGEFARQSEELIMRLLGSSRVLLTPSCTAALEMAAILLDLQPEDEVIVPSYTFVSTANAFALMGAKIVFVDVNPLTMNIDPDSVAKAITEKTRAIVPVHYAGVACDMDSLMSIAERYGLVVIEDAAQAIGSFYKGKPLGSIGHMATFSFHETKNVTSGGEGGALCINDSKHIERAEIIREKGTNRNQFFRGQVDKYSWVDIGSSYLPSEIQAAFLYGQLKGIDGINSKRVNIWRQYLDHLSSLFDGGVLEPPFIPDYASNNGHMFYVKCKDLQERSELIAFLKDNGIMAAFHYVPLHSSVQGRSCGRMEGEDKYTTKESERLVRLPMYYSLSSEDVTYICDTIKSFFKI
ncbi:dTDP-4-amino-4,6-dideoxygalactose transaminase [Vibrio sp. JC009]|uniref:dTDP-4-amino-4,6-dideoxygalactose transaminase n=1 Tax=Vibrio sp. JC009 TaxID=2912314 RepID=UPI0023AEF050|nr:dTDP-4-amino-4,6-dideoxygalactose transaminase [Vibrio sp. JC009]WED22009.1 dTDP-4-amino-4,6-dideoxygalactose transaminase [Vibrio sp. JC009]